jgi:hypothetical protein
MADKIQSSTHGEYQAGQLVAQAQAVAGPLTRAAIFLVATLNPGSENRDTLRSFLRRPRRPVAGGGIS